MELIKNIIKALTFRNIAYALSGRMFLVVLLSFWAMFSGKELSWPWVAIGVAYMLCNPLNDLFNKHMNDLIEIAKAWVKLPPGPQKTDQADLKE